MFAVVADQIGQGEAVVAGDEVDARLGFALLVAVDVGAADQPLADAGRQTPIALDEPAHVVAEAAVPLLPVVTDEAAHLIEAGGIPGLGDQLGAGQHRIGVDVPEDRREGRGLAVLVPVQHRGQIEAEAIDMQMLHPVAQALADQTPHHRMVGVEGVAAAGVVDVGAIARLQVVVAIRQTTEAESRPLGVAFGGVVEHHIQDHLDAGPV